MNLIIDLGNTLAKVTIFKGCKVLNTEVFEPSCEFDEKKLKGILNHYSIKKVILSSVINTAKSLCNFLYDKFNENFVELGIDTNIPLKNLYKTPQTLGKDRIAAAVGAVSLFSNQNILLIDSGTAITIDLITSNSEFLGGNISPGIKIRFKALHSFTGKLPLLSITEEYPLTGQTTDEAICAGVLNGVVFEIQSYIEEYSKKYDNLQIVLTGGDCFFFEKKIKKTIFAESNLLALGLNSILENNT